MKVLFVTHYPELYGANMSMCNVAETLKRRHEVDVTVLCLSQEARDLKKMLAKSSIDINVCRFYNTTFKPGKKVDKIKAWINCIRNSLKLSKMDQFFYDNQFDIVHTNTLATLVGAQLAKRHGIPHIWHLREFLEEDYDSSQIKGTLFRNLTNYTTGFIAISDSIQRKYESIVGNDKIVRIYNGIPPKKYCKRTSSYNKVIFVLVGVIRMSKGTIDAIQAYLKLYNEGYYNSELWLIGGGMENRDDPYIKQIDSIIKNCNCTTNIKFFGYRNDVDQLLDKADVGLICSRLEAFGRVTIEYMMKGLYVIGANSGGTVELIEDGKTGALYEVGNVDSLTNQMKDYINGIEQKVQIIDRAIKYGQTFSIDSCVINIYNFYKQILLHEKSLP